jgi:hypothetical protein
METTSKSVLSFIVSMRRSPYLPLVTTPTRMIH